MLQIKIIYCKLFIFTIILSLNTLGQKKTGSSLVVNNLKDSTTKNILSQDTVNTKKFIPRIATMRSALIPGWGQAYNKKYWKIPIIYGALGTTGYIFLYNLKTYKLLREAFIARTDLDTSHHHSIDADINKLTTESIRSNRNAYRQNVDFSVLYFLAFWAINVVDATVDAHLKSFDVNDNISFKLKPRIDLFSRSSALCIAFSFHEKRLNVTAP